MFNMRHFGSMRISLGLGAVIGGVTYAVAAYLPPTLLVSWAVGWFTYLGFMLATDAINLGLTTNIELRKITELLDAQAHDRQ